MQRVRVTFDSNVFEILTGPQRQESPSQAEALQSLRKFIWDGVIEPFAFEGMMTYESLDKRIRADALIASRPIMNLESVGEGSRCVTKISLVPNRKLPVTVHEHRQQAMCTAMKWGFRFLRVPRMAGYYTQDLPILIEQDDDAFYARLERTQKFLCAIESEGAGLGRMRHLAGLARTDSHVPIHELARRLAPEKIAAAVAEWMDGDALAAHYGHGLDFFCTLDRGRGAGGHSILHSSKRRMLEQDWAVHIRTPSELVDDLGRRITTEKVS